MTIQVQLKNVYGNELIYPVCETAKKFASLVGRKTLTTNDIRGIQSLGYEVEVTALTGIFSKAGEK